MQRKMDLRETPKSIFTLSEVRDNLREHYQDLKLQYESAVDTKNFLMLKQVTPLTALQRAKNIFAHDGFEKLHAQQTSYEEILTQFELDKSHYLLWQQAFNDKKWTSDGDRPRELYYLIKQKTYLAEMERNLS